MGTSVAAGFIAQGTRRHGKAAVYTGSCRLWSFLYSGSSHENRDPLHRVCGWATAQPIRWPRVCTCLLYTSVVILKHGGDGCYVSDGQQSFHMPPFKVNAIDTTGAGDNFTGGFMTAVLKGFSLRECARFANATGAISVQSIGTTTAIQNFQQVMDFLATHPA